MLIDTHCHLTSREFRGKVRDVLQRAADADVTRAIVVAEDPRDARVALDLLEEHPNLYLAAGVHPHRAANCDRDMLTALAEVLRGEGVRADLKRRIVAVGETGLDFHYDFSPRKQQEELFHAQLALAVQLDRPVVIHARASEARVCEMLGDYSQLVGRVVFHCFSADTTIARRVLDLGCYCSFTGVVTFPKAELIQQTARYVPRDRIMLETDAPYLSPVPVRKIRPNEPALLVHTARFLADGRGETLDALAAATTANAVRFFGLPEDGL